ncbi:MAG: hypothetical protein AVDCRST_MAG60-1615, partial [uncultured Nocardioides sp.]
APSHGEEVRGVEAARPGRCRRHGGGRCRDRARGARAPVVLARRGPRAAAPPARRGGGALV